MSTSRRFAVIGCGRLGVSLSVFLCSEGFEAVSFFSRSTTSAGFAREVAGRGEVFPDAAAAAKVADIVFITTPDTEIAAVCYAIAGAGGVGPGSTVFHLSGALASDILAGAAALGAETGSIHPLQSFAPYKAGQGNPFAGINMSVEGSPAAAALGEKIVSALGAAAFTIPTRAKGLYHASAVVASNYLVTLEHMALELLMETGLSESKAFNILEPLIQGTLANIRDRGSARALTGPVARGDVSIVAGHLKDIDAKRPEFSKMYRMLGRHTLDIARSGLTREAERELSRLLGSDEDDA